MLGCPLVAFQESCIRDAKQSKNQLDISYLTVALGTVGITQEYVPGNKKFYHDPPPGIVEHQ